MKFSAKKLAIVSALVVLSAFSAPCRAFAAQTSVPQISQNCVFSSTDDAAQQMRAYLKEHSSDFEIEISANVAPKETVGQIMIYKAFDETGNGSEGDYLRFGVKKLNCKIYLKNDSYRLVYHIDYYTTAEEEEKLTQKTDELLASFHTDGLSDYNKALLIYRYVTSKVTYSSDISDKYAYTAYSAMENGNAVCQGVAQLLYRLYNDSGIPCRIIAGVARDSDGVREDSYHVWLLTKIDGKYYLSDPTWDLSAVNDNFRYFLKGSDEFDNVSNMKHIPQNDNGLTFPEYNSDEFQSAYPVTAANAPQPGCSSGDIDGSGSINALDASFILSDYSRFSTCGMSALTISQKSFADVNNDNSVNAVDASCVLAYYAYSSCGGKDSIDDYIKNEVLNDVRRK
ncbi:transglutaminase domain-containing protein [Ruminococcus flavefaciens]|uniref:transglutaminase domain-containing protein n=1 Tax=Ruminococcus flavefaciens TaxID=1265 RepID=UPI0004661923|nr:transglutaminase domain-containing protein [Ruminococcus flavefaciens]